MDYLKPQYDYLKGKLKGKLENRICVDSSHDRTGVVCNEYMMFIPDDKRYVTGAHPLDATFITANFESNSKVDIDKIILNYNKKLQVIFSNGTKANKKFIDLFEGCEFYNNGASKPIYCLLDDEIVGVVMPMR